MIKMGDKLKTINEFRDMVIEQLGHHDPLLQNAAYDHQSKVHMMVEMMSRMLFDQQMMYHSLVLQASAPKAYDYGAIEQKVVAQSMPVEQTCQHEYVDKVLFNTTYRACKHCDMDKPKFNKMDPNNVKPPGRY